MLRFSRRRVFPDMSSLLDKLRAALAPQYEVERELASGVMGSLFVGRDRVLHRQVAIEVLQPEMATDRTLERFLSESRTLARLKHADIVPVFQAGEAEGISYYVMEYIEGETLGGRLERLPLSRTEILKLADDPLSALEAAHGQGIVLWSTSDPELRPILRQAEDALARLPDEE